VLRFLLALMFVIIVGRAFWQVVDGVIEGVTGQPRSTRVPQRGVQMVRDPVCGTFVVPDRSVMLAVKGKQVYFCSTTCRDQYQAAHSA
jgi:uncharacterized protein